MNKQVLGKAFKKDQKFVYRRVGSLDETTAKIEKDFEESEKRCWKTFKA